MGIEQRRTTHETIVDHHAPEPAVEAASNSVTDAERVIREQTVMTGGRAETTAVQETTVVVPSAATLQRRRLARTRRIIYTVVNVMAIFTVIRIVLALLGANPDNAFASFIYLVTSPFLLPFQGLFGAGNDPTFGVSVFEVENLVAIAFYYLIAWIVSRVVTLSYMRNRTDPATGDMIV